MSKTPYKNVDIKIETKQINRIFSVYKDTQTFINETRVFYGLCFNDEVENFKENLIYPERGSMFILLHKDTPPEYKFKKHTNEELLYPYMFPIEKFFNENYSVRELYKELLNYSLFKFDKEKEEIILFNYDLNEPYPIRFFEIFEQDIGITNKEYDLYASFEKLKERDDIEFVSYFSENDSIIETISDISEKDKSNGVGSEITKRLNFEWTPNDTDWVIYLTQLLKYDRKTALKYVADNIFELPKLKKLNLETEETNLDVEFRTMFEESRINKDCIAYRMSHKIGNKTQTSHGLCLYDEVNKLENNLIIPKNIKKDNYQYFIVKKSLLEDYRTNDDFATIINHYLLPIEDIMEKSYLYEENVVLVTKKNYHSELFKYNKEMPLPHPIYFSPYIATISNKDYDLDAIETTLQDLVDNNTISFYVRDKYQSNPLDEFYDEDKKEIIVLYWIPTKTEWKELNEKFFKENNYKDIDYSRLDVQQYIADNFLRLPKKGESNE